MPRKPRRKVQSTGDPRPAESSPSVRDVIHILGHGIHDDALWRNISKWPPDVFAVTSVLLEETGAYRLVVSPPTGCKWPTRDKWCDQVRITAQEWILAASTGAEPPSRVLDCLGALRDILAWELSIFDRDSRPTIPGLQWLDAKRWQKISRVLDLHALADESCAGMGMATRRPYKPSRYYDKADALLVEHGSLSQLPRHLVRVLPKLRTPQLGITIRSLSQHVTADRSGIEVAWRKLDDLGPDTQVDRLNILMLPWPLDVSDGDFHVLSSPLRNMDGDKFGAFEFIPRLPGFRRAFGRAVRQAKKSARIDAVVMPEAALTESQASEACAILGAESIPLMIAGVRGSRYNLARLKDCRMPVGNGVYDQHKHHRWCLDRRQIEQYELGFVLHPAKKWWEGIDVRCRTLQCIITNEWLTICPLVCEDLARVEPVTQLIRGIGPTLIVGLLQDGPQLKARWPARYATVLADDPGSSVLTVTSLGMALRSVGGGQKALRTVALWKDPNGARELELPEDSVGLVLTVCREWQTEWSADGRSDGGRAAQLFLAGVKPLPA